MKDPNCMYCAEHSERRDSLMIHLTELPASTVYIFREQTYYGRCIVASKMHKKELYELTAEELSAYMADVARVAKAMQAVTGADKINYGIYGDKVPHIHFHLVPKKEGGRNFGGTFELVFEERTELTEEGYRELAEKLLANL